MKEAAVGTDGSSVARTMKPRTVRCPKCRQFFETHRRWSMSCPECGHEWEETSKRGLGDRVRDFDIVGRLVMAALWLGLTGMIGFLLFRLVYGALESKVASAGGIAGALVLVIAAGTLYALVHRASWRPYFNLVDWLTHQQGEAQSEKDREQRR